jgi:hypothetical protein
MFKGKKERDIFVTFSKVAGKYFRKMTLHVMFMSCDSKLHPMSFPTNLTRPLILASETEGTGKIDMRYLGRK